MTTRSYDIGRPVYPLIQYVLLEKIENGFPLRGRPFHTYSLSLQTTSRISVSLSAQVVVIETKKTEK